MEITVCSSREAFYGVAAHGFLAVMSNFEGIFMDFCVKILI